MQRWTPREVMRSAGPPGRQAVRDSRATRGGPGTTRSAAGMPVSSPNTRVESFILSGYNGKPTRGTVTIHAFDREQRVRRAHPGLREVGGRAAVRVLPRRALRARAVTLLASRLANLFARLGADERARAAR